jgi:AraC family transcriptional regulator of adaptative response/methylated-DNA-[protein]-cysteine methyltransferase
MTQQQLNTENDPRWTRVVARDATADGQFYYSVRTMGVYCRPSCPSRLALPQNVQFHSTPQDAEQAGFRPCKRCKPREERPAIRFAVRSCSLGSILVAGTQRGLCAVLLGDDPDLLVRDLQNRFPRIHLMPEAPAYIEQVVQFVEFKQTACDFPLDVSGTAFQQRVWQALREIPMGSTASYTDIAVRIGSPRSVRAVALACGANPLAIVIPCHRVVRSDGGLSGYRWGVQRKQILLQREAQQ